MTPTIEPLTLRTEDGLDLAAHLFRPAPAADRRATVQIHSATAVQQGIYRKYAQFLAAQGWTALTFDYRGTGASLPGSIRDFEGRMHHWGERDVPAVTDWLEQRFPNHRRLAVVHSVGGQILGLGPNCDRLDGVFGVCVQWGSWKNWPIPRRWLYKVLFHAVAPPLTALRGYFPGRWFGMGDLPATIGNDWMRWCRSPHYLCDDDGRPLRPHYHRLRCPVHWLGFTDDPAFGPPKAVRAMPALYPNAEHRVEIIDPQVMDIGPVGHFGFFRSRFRDTLWQLSHRWLAQTTS